MRILVSRKKNKLLEQLEGVGLIDKNLSGEAKHIRLKGLLNQMSVSGGLDNPLVEVGKKVDKAMLS